MNKLFFFAIFSLTITLQLCSAREPAKVQVIPNRKSDNLTVHVKTEDSDTEHEHQLNLKKPESSVFTLSFKIQINKGDLDGNSVFEENDFGRNEIEEAERGVYVDPKSDSAIHVHQDGNGGEYRITGLFKGHVISHVNGKHFVTKPTSAIANKTKPHETETKDKVTEPEHEHVEKPEVKVDKPENLTKISDDTAVESHPPVFIQPELLIVLDNTNYNTFGGNQTAMITYISLMINSVNHRFANVLDPKIRFKVSGLHAISSPSAQPFITSNPTPKKNGFKIDKVLESFGKWVHSNLATLPKHDLAVLLTAVHLHMPDRLGHYTPGGVAGAANLRGACVVEGNSNKGSLVTTDAGGAYIGVTSLTHELAHTLGAPHDGEEDSAHCPSSDGYIMSYEGMGKQKKFYFSECSIAAMKKFINSPIGSCLKTLQSATQWTMPNLYPGDLMNMTTQCQITLDNPTAYADHTHPPDEICKDLVCIYTDPHTKKLMMYTVHKYPADGSYCGNGGSCFNGKCVVKEDMSTQCQIMTGHANAYVDPSISADSLCSNLVCAFPDPSNPSAHYQLDTNKPPVDYSPCGNQGRCIDGKCSQVLVPRASVVIPPSLKEQCISDTGKSDAVVDPDKTADELCSNLMCQYRVDISPNQYALSSVSFNRPPKDYTPCGTNGNCVKGKCVVGGI